MKKITLLTNNIPNRNQDIPYLELPVVEESFSIPYIRLIRQHSTTEASHTLPAITSVTKLILRGYTETLRLLTRTQTLILFTVILGVISSYLAYSNNAIVSYGDAESHLNIAKRVIHSITPGLSQLGGIWLPLPHILMIPFVTSDFLWRTGLAGTIVSGISFIIAAVTLFKLTMLLTRNRLASFVSFLIFVLNPNILYLQSTPMTELPLIMFFMLSTYFFVKYLQNRSVMLSLIAAAFFGFCASLSRYDGWLLVGIEAGVLGVLFLNQKISFSKIVGRLTFFSSLAFFGIVIWLIWGYTILGDPLYFTTSEFSAKSQQLAWLQRGELPAHHNILVSLAYYTMTAMTNVGALLFSVSFAGILLYLLHKPTLKRIAITIVLFCPFIFYVTTLYLGQSVIFIPSLTPESFEWNLFNVRYGVMMVPICAVFFSYLIAKVTPGLKINLIGIVALQTILFATQAAPAVSLTDGMHGLSQYKHTDAQNWIADNYDQGLVLMDDFARSMSIIRSPIPMQQIIYIGNEPYWEESLIYPEKYARWIVMQRGDTLWTEVYENTPQQARLYTHFQKVYTSPDILIFKKI